MPEHPDIGEQLSEQHKIAQAFMRIVRNPKTKKDLRKEALNGLIGYTHIEGVIDVLISIMENHRIDEETRTLAAIALAEHEYPEIDLEGTCTESDRPVKEVKPVNTVAKGRIPTEELRSFCTEHELSVEMFLEDSIDSFGCVLLGFQTPKTLFTATFPIRAANEGMTIYFDYEDAFSSDRRAVKSFDKLPVKFKNILNYLQQKMVQ